MTFLETLKLIPKAVVSFLKAIIDNISDNLYFKKNNDNDPSFDIIYNRITQCKNCIFRYNENCIICGCNCFIKCELSGECPLWDAEYVSVICDLSNFKHDNDILQINFKLFKHPEGSDDTDHIQLANTKDDDVISKLLEKKFILYKEHKDSNYKLLFLDI